MMMMKKIVIEITIMLMILIRTGVIHVIGTETLLCCPTRITTHIPLFKIRILLKI